MLKCLPGVAAFLYCTGLYSQLPVRNEPRHHNVFENDYVRVLDVFIGPKDTTFYHLHNTPSVFIIYTKTKVGSQLAGKQPEEGINLPGDINYDSLTTPRFHRVWNKDTGWFHVMDIELTRIKNKSDIPVLQNPFVKLLFNKKQANGYNIELKPGNVLQLPASVNGYLILSKGETVIKYKINELVQHRIMKAGHYIWIEAGKKTSLVVSNQMPAAFALLQLK
jgi:quercetin dioxygenase-like cupin family protein